MSTWIVFRHALHSPEDVVGGRSIVGSIAASTEREARLAAHARWMLSARDRLELVPADCVPPSQRNAARSRAHVDLAEESRRMDAVFMDGWTL